MPAVTELARDKTTRAVAATTPGGVRFGAYEIHLGVTTLAHGAVLAPFARLDDGSARRRAGAGVLGTYLHGALEHPARVRRDLRHRRSRPTASKASQYQRMAAWFGEHARHLDDLGVG